MRVDDFDFDLPEDRIALRPMVPRDAARLLVVNAPNDGAESLVDRHASDLPSLLWPGDALVFNDTEVIPARLSGERRRETSVAHVDVTLHKRVGPDTWRVFARPAKRLREDDRVEFGDGFSARVAQREGGEVVLVFNVSGDALDHRVAQAGSMPLPPYIATRRTADARDVADYQTVYARAPGAVAAPTAGLHFTPDLLARLSEAGIAGYHLTLHVGAGTFLPMQVEDTKDHHMHSEWGEISAETAQSLNAVRAVGGRIIAVGTTAMRLLETAAGADGTIAPFAGETDIFITPGYRFKAVDGLMTNFHLPRSTLFMLVCAFAGTQRVRDAYSHAIASGYRFYSYGDGSLLFRGEET